MAELRRKLANEVQAGINQGLEKFFQMYKLYVYKL